MTHQQWNEIERSLQGLSARDKIELIERLAHSIRAEAIAPAPQEQQAEAAHKPIWEVFQEISDSIPEEEWAKLPPDGAEQHDHYIYGTPKRPPA